MNLLDTCPHALSTLRKSRQSNSTTLSSLLLRVRHPIFVEFRRSIGGTLVEFFFQNLERICRSDLKCEKLPSMILALFVSLDLSLSFSSSICWPWTIRREIYISLTSIVRYSLTTILETSETNLLIFALGSTIIVGAYQDNCMSFKAYSFTLILPWWRLVNSITFASLISREWTYQVTQLWTHPIERKHIFWFSWSIAWTIF